jgi:addiction module HigA family antidote
MITRNRNPAHPGEVLIEDYLKPLGVTQVAFAEHIGVPVQRINEIIRGKRGVTPETAWLLAQSLGTPPEFWTSLQADHDLARMRPGRRVGRIRGRR